MLTCVFANKPGRRYVWLGQRGVRTPLHYDYYNNIYLQILGKKRFLILPPSHHNDVNLYPSLHPAHRSSQIANFTAALTVSATSRAAPAYEVVLEPGDVLFLPALWLHEVTTLGDVTISANVWCVCMGWELRRCFAGGWRVVVCMHGVGGGGSVCRW